MFDVITVGGASRDVFFVTSEGKVLIEKDSRYLSFQYGSKIIPEECLYTYGGGGANSAVSFAKLSLNVAAVMNIGVEGTGSLVVKDLKEVGVDCEFISRDKDHHTGLSVIVGVKNRDHIMFLDRGANDFLVVPDWRPLKTKWIYLTSLTGESAEIIPELFSYATAHGIKIAWNPGSEQLAKGFDELESYLEATDTLILNRDEAKELIFSRFRNPKLKDEEEILRDLFEMTGKLVVMTDGEKGSYVFDGQEIQFEPATPEKAVETTGAGDAFGSTFVAGQILGLSLKESMRLASVNAGNVIKQIGAQQGLMTFDELRVKI